MYFNSLHFGRIFQTASQWSFIIAYINSLHFYIIQVLTLIMQELIWIFTKIIVKLLNQLFADTIYDIAHNKVTFLNIQQKYMNILIIFCKKKLQIWICMEKCKQQDSACNESSHHPPKRHERSSIRSFALVLTRCLGLIGAIHQYIKS